MSDDARSRLSSNSNFEPATPERQSDDALLGAVRFGRVEALRTIYDRYAGVVMAVALRIVRDSVSAEEIVQRVFYDLWKDLEEGAANVAGLYAGSLLNGLVTHARTLAIQHRDASPPSVEVPADLLLMATADQNDCDDSADSSDPNLRWQREKTLAALARVPADARRVLEMVCLDALKVDEIARRLDLPRDGVRLLLLTGLHQFREALKPTPATRWFEATDFPLVNLDRVGVLLVDDEPDAREVLARVLQTLGAFVTTAASAAEALAMLAKIKPEVLVCDLAMPDEDGFDLIRQIRRAGRTVRDLPAIALTAYASPQVRRQTLMAGFQVHVPKPVDPNQLAEVVASFAGRTGLQ